MYHSGDAEFEDIVRFTVVKICQGTLHELRAAYGENHIIVKTDKPVDESVLRRLFASYTIGLSGEIIINTTAGEKELLQVAEQIKKYAAIESLELRKPTLDDIFLAKTGNSLRN